MPRAPDRTDRNTYIGASRVGALMGMDPFMSRFDLWALMTRRASGEQQPKPIMKRGLALEDDIRDELRDRSDVLELHNPEPGEFWLDENGILGTHPDGRIRIEHPTLGELGAQDEGSLEMKTVDSWVLDGYQLEGLPAAHVLQLNTTAGLMAKPHGVFVVHHADRWIQLLFPMAFSQAVFDGVREEAARFMRDHVQKDVAPDPFPVEEVEVVRLGAEAVYDESEEWVGLMDDYGAYREAKAMVKEVWEGAKGEDAGPGLSQRIRDHMVGLETEVCIGGGWKYIYRPGTTRNVFEEKLLTMMGPYDPQLTADILEEHQLEPAVVQSILGQLGLRARVGPDDPRLRRDIPAPYNQGFPLKEG